MIFLKLDILIVKMRINTSLPSFNCYPMNDYTRVYLCFEGGPSRETISSKKRPICLL